jgi:hypothetical protein
MSVVIDRTIESLEELAVQVLAAKLQAIRDARRPIDPRQLQLHGCEVCD